MGVATNSPGGQPSQSGSVASWARPRMSCPPNCRLWVAYRFLEGRWRGSGKDALGVLGFLHRYDRDPIIQVPPFINYQMATIFTERILKPLRVSASQS